MASTVKVEPDGGAGVGPVRSRRHGMAWRMAAREHFGRGGVLGFVLILAMIVLVLLAMFWPVA